MMSKDRKDANQDQVMAQGHPGMSAPAEGSDGAIMLEDEEFTRLASLLENERSLLNNIAEITLHMDDIKTQADDIKTQAKEARGKRDEFCLSLERKYNVQKGAVWDLDTDRKAIVVKQKGKQS